MIGNATDAVPSVPKTSTGPTSTMPTSTMPTSTMMVAIEDFESFDGVDGRPTGEQVLERVAWLIMATARTTDIVFRRTAETFCVLLPETEEPDAVVLAERVRMNVDQMPLLAESNVEVSVGVSTGSYDDLANTVDRAEQVRAERLLAAASMVASATVRAELADLFAAATPVRPEPAPVSMLPPASTPFAPPMV